MKQITIDIEDEFYNNLSKELKKEKKSITDFIKIIFNKNAEIILGNKENKKVKAMSRREIKKRATEILNKVPNAPLFHPKDKLNKKK